jgi:Spy/CpxP family protein refolding chaperone
MERANRRIAVMLVAALLPSLGSAETPQGTTEQQCPHMQGMGMHGHACAGPMDGCPMMQPGAGPMGPMGGMGGGAPWMSRMDGLNISAEQRAAMQQIFERYRTRGVELAQRGSGVRSELMDVAPEDPGYPAATERAAEAAAGIAADAVKLMSDMRGEMNAILTPEQRQQLRDRMAAKQQRWEEWRNRHKPAAQPTQ